MGVGISAAFCFPESLCYLKSMQNGNPVFKAYKLIPYNQDNNSETNERDIAQLLKEFDERLQNLERQNKKGGRLDELL